MCHDVAGLCVLEEFRREFLQMLPEIVSHVEFNQPRRYDYRFTNQKSEKSAEESYTYD
jgi:hypothetical protein